MPGSSSGTAAAMADTQLIGWLKKAHETSKWTTSVCSGALVLAAADLLRGLPATTHWFAQDLLSAFGATPQPDRRIVRAGKVITAAGVSAGLDLALTLIGEICGEERAQIAQLGIEYDPQPPFDAGHPSKASKAVFDQAKAEMRRDSTNLREAVAIPRVLWHAAISKVRSVGRKSALS